MCLKTKSLFVTLTILSVVLGNINGQTDSTYQESVYENSIYPGFKPFPTPRTTGRPGTVFRIDLHGIRYYVEDVKMIMSYTSDEGNIIGRMVFTPVELLQMLNIEFSSEEPIWVEVELEKVEREYNEQTQLDDILWEKDKIDQLVVDEFSTYYIIRETISTKKLTCRFTEEDFSKILTGANQLIKLKAKKGVLPDFPYEITKSWREPRRVFYLDQKIGLDIYPEEEED